MNKFLREKLILECFLNVKIFLKNFNIFIAEKKIWKKFAKFSQILPKKVFFFEILGSKIFFQFLKIFFEKILSWRWKFRMLCFFSYIKHGSKLSEGFYWSFYGKSGLHRRLCKTHRRWCKKKFDGFFSKIFLDPSNNFHKKT